MSSKITRIVMEDGSSFDYEEKPIDHFRKTAISETKAKDRFYNQYKYWEEEALSYFNLEIEDYAKERYDLIDSDEKKDIGDFDDDDILMEAELRCLLPESTELENSNILNEGFVDRFVNIVNRGDNSEIENTLSYLEFKYKIS